jgi:hypothetical protein
LTTGAQEPVVDELAAPPLPPRAPLPALWLLFAYAISFAIGAAANAAIVATVNPNINIVVF